MQKYQNMEHSNSKTFQGLSRAWHMFNPSTALWRMMICIL